MTLTADLYFSFRSPYSYLAVGRYRRLTQTHDVDIALRTVLPIAIRDPDLLFTGNPAAPRYIFRDSARAAEMLDIPFRWPRPDPVVQDLSTGAIAGEQPHIWPVVRMAQAAARRDAGLAFADEVTRIIWSGDVDGWNEGDHLRHATERAGLDYDNIRAEAENDANALDTQIRANQDALEKAGHWGVPTLVFDGEPFFGQDRIDMAVWRMKQKGLAER